MYYYISIIQYILYSINIISVVLRVYIHVETIFTLRRSIFYYFLTTVLKILRFTQCLIAMQGCNRASGANNGPHPSHLSPPGCPSMLRDVKFRSSEPARWPGMVMRGWIYGGKRVLSPIAVGFN